MSRPISRSSVSKSAHLSVSCVDAPVALGEVGSVIDTVATGADSPALRAVLTRPADRQQSLLQHLQSQGWDVLSLPALQLVPTDFVKDSSVSSPGFLQWQPEGFDWVMFVSRAAWQFYRRQIGPYWPASTGIAVVGSGTARIIAQDFKDGSIQVEAEAESEPGPGSVSTSARMLVPDSGDTQDSEGLWRQLASHLTPESRVLIVAGEEGRSWMRDRIRAHGAHCKVLTCYRRVAAPIDTDTAAKLEQWVGGNPMGSPINCSVHDVTHHVTHNATGSMPNGGVWLFTSRHSIEANQQALNEAGLLARIRPAGLVVTHERLVEPARHWLKNTGASPDMTQNTPVWVSHPDDDSLQATFAQVRVHVLKRCTTDTRPEA